jgi:glycosyltransferase involved in cell wall biosynthesis|tara:strand:+ start:9698 stop:10381 length:684 start_codon:yes stop_codon:yes gene_type:complete
MNDLSIVIPFYNEEENVEKVVFSLKKELIKNKIDFELILVDNGSLDRTPKIVDDLKKKDKRIKVLHISKNIGYGNGIINGLRLGSFKYVGYTDGDGQVRSEDVISCYHKIIKTNTDICKGRRLKKEGTFLRKFFSQMYDLLFFLVFFKFYKDINAKPKIIRKECLSILNLRSKEWFIDNEIMIGAIKNKFKVSEIPVVVNSRKKDSSNVNPDIILNCLKNIIKYRLN